MTTPKSTFDTKGRTLTIKGLIPTTPEEDFKEMQRLWKAQSNANYKPYTKKSILLASGGEKKQKNSH